MAQSTPLSLVLHVKIIEIVILTSGTKQLKLSVYLAGSNKGSVVLGIVSSLWL